MQAITRVQVGQQEFARQVRSALACLYDPVSQRTQPLARTLGVDGRSLQECLLGAVDAVKPGPHVDPGARVWRRSRLLQARYVEARDPADVAREIGLSKSQYYREHEQALEQLTALLWEQYSTDTAAAPVAESRPPRIKPRHNLPLQITSFIGREQELAEVRRLLGTTRLLTLTGAGGSGKTRLAVEAAAELLHAYADGAWLVELAPVAVPTLVPQTVASTLGVRDAAGEPIEATLIRTMADQQRLIVLDNCEHVIDASARLVEALLHACPNLVVLATSREPLRIAGETVLRVPTLSTPDPASSPEVERLRSYEAVSLFLDRAVAVQRGFVLTSENAQAIADICHRLDGIPLAIELVAARVPMLSPQQIRDRLQDCFRLLTGGSRTALPRHRTLRAMVEWSYELLSEPEKAVLRRLSVFSGGWTLEAAEAVCCGEPVAQYQVLELLGQLVSKSLVLTEGMATHSVRYRTLETFRQYGQEHLEARGELATRFEAHARYFLALAKAGDQGLASASQLRWFGQLEAERDNFRIALARCRDGKMPQTDQSDIGPSLACHLFQLWNMRAHLREGAYWLATMASVAQAPVTSAAAICHAQGGFFHFLLGNRELGQSLANQAIELAEELKDTEARCWVRCCRGALFVFSGDAAAAEQQGYLAVALADEGPDSWLRAFARIVLGAALVHRGKDQEALEVLNRELELGRALGDRHVIGLGLAYLGHISMHQRNYALAETQLAEGFRLLEEIGSTAQMLRPGNLLAQLALQQGDAETARTRYRRNLEAARDTAWHEHLINALAGLAMTEALARRPEPAVQLFGAVSALRAGTGTTPPPVQKAEEERHLAAVQASLSKSEYDMNWAKGAAMSLDQAVDFSLSQSTRSTLPE